MTFFLLTYLLRNTQLELGTGRHRKRSNQNGTAQMKRSRWNWLSELTLVVALYARIMIGIAHLSDVDDIFLPVLPE